MKMIKVSEQESGQRLDKLLFKYMNQASMGFIFKMLRKKNITLNGKKADGSEHVYIGDEIRLFLSDETIIKFQKEKEHLLEKAVSLDILYEDAHILLVNKPAGMLTQKTESDDLSLNEYYIDYLLKSGALTKEQLRTFTPSVCNRLDRNTSGIVICGKSLIGLQTMAKALRERSLHKYYICLVNGMIKEDCLLRGYLTKDEDKNQAQIHEDSVTRSSYIETRYHPLCHPGNNTLLEVELITGKPHQIRAHLAANGHPIIGDTKYGDSKYNKRYREQYQVNSQLLHAYKLVMPRLSGALEHLSEQTFTAVWPKRFQEVTGMAWEDLIR